MGKFNFTALRVRQTALKQAATGRISRLPQWVDVVGDIPPSQVVVRPQLPQHQLVRQRVKTVHETVETDSGPEVVTKAEVVEQPLPKPVRPKKASRVFQPVKIKYEEDILRKEFFRDHPWELARPRVLVENTGKDFENHDWQRLQQPGKQLDGESVVQRQLWLLNNVPDITKTEAYDIARREFYKLRLQQDIERRVAVEEAEATGAVFGPTYLEIGMQLENKQYENWKAWAKQEAQLQNQKAASFAGAPQTGTDEEDVALEVAEEVPVEAERPERPRGTTMEAMKGRPL